MTGHKSTGMNIAFLGIGLMGFPMSVRLCVAGHAVNVWNRDGEKAKRLTPYGAKVHTHAAVAVREADVVITMLQDGDAVHSVLFDEGTALAARKGTLFIDMSSIKPMQARDHADKLHKLGMRCMDAPVSGGTVGAEQATLAIMVGSDPKDFEYAVPVFECMGRATRVGPVGSGQLAKLANQMIVGITIGAVAEALLMCEKGGADIAQVRKAISGGFAESRVLQLHGQRMVERDFEPRARLSVQLKDMRNAITTAKELGFQAPITEHLEKLYAKAMEHGFSDLDHSGLFAELALLNHMK